MSIMKVNQARKGSFLLYSAAFLWGSTFIFQKTLLLEGIQPFYMIGIRFSFIIVTIFSIQWHKIPKYTWLHGLVLGTLLFVAFSLQTFGLKTLDSSVSAFLTGTLLIFTPILSHFIDRKSLNILNIIAVSSAFVGVYFFNLDSNAHFTWNTGSILTILCALTYAIHLIITARFVQTSNPVELNVVQSIVCSLIGFASGFAFNEPFPQVWTPLSIVSILYLGLIGSILCYTLQSMGQKLVKNVIKVTLILALEPLFAVLLAVPILGESIGLSRLAGMIFIFGGILLSEWQSIKEHKELLSVKHDQRDQKGEGR
ncbi:MAG: DMT family transporter [Brevinema sp.]